MQTLIPWVAAIAVVSMFAAVFLIHALRALIASRILSDEEFDQFRRNGIMSQFSILEPTRLKWEYHFVLTTLGESDHPKAGLLASAWRWSCRLLLLSGLVFAIGSIAHAFL